MVSANDFAMVGFKYIGTSYETMDCQKFVERCMADVGLKMDLPGSNAWYRKMDWVGTPEECKARLGFSFLWLGLGWGFRDLVGWRMKIIGF